MNRFDGVVVFKPLGQVEVGQITQLLLAEFSQKMKEKDIEVTFSKRYLLSETVNQAMDGKEVAWQIEKIYDALYRKP